MEDFFEAQRRQQALQAEALTYYVGVLRRIIGHAPATASWSGTSRDLVEMVDLVSAQRAICDCRGVPLSRAALARQAFAATGLHMPSNLSSVVYRIRNRVDASYGLLARWGRRH